MPGKNLIFLISQPRAGSTLLNLLLSSHKDIASASEGWISLHPIFAMKNYGNDSVFNSFLAKQALDEFFASNNITHEFHQEQIGIFLNSFYEKAIENQQKKFFLDKTPRYFYIIDELIDIFPNAKFIFLYRNPAAVLNSIINTWIKDDESLILNFMDDLLLAPSNMVKSWAKYPKKIFTLKYENLVCNPKDTLIPLYNFLNLKGDIITSYALPETQSTLGDPIGVKKHKKPSAINMDNWINELSSSKFNRFALSYIKAVGKKTFQLMGYDYNKILNSIEGSSSKTNLVDFQKLYSINQALSHSRDIKRAVFYKIMDDNENRNQKPGLEKLINQIANTETQRLSQSMKNYGNEMNRLRVELFNGKDSLLWKYTKGLRELNHYLRMFLKK